MHTHNTGEGERKGIEKEKIENKVKAQCGERVNE